MAVYVITETATQDPKVGGPVRVAKISYESGYNQLDASYINEVIEKNKNINKTLKQCFYGEN